MASLLCDTQKIPLTICDVSHTPVSRVIIIPPRWGVKEIPRHIPAALGGLARGVPLAFHGAGRPAGRRRRLSYHRS